MRLLGSFDTYTVVFNALSTHSNAPKFVSQPPLPRRTCHHSAFLRCMPTTDATPLSTGCARLAIISYLRASRLPITRHHFRLLLIRNFSSLYQHMRHFFRFSPLMCKLLQSDDQFCDELVIIVVQSVPDDRSTFKYFLPSSGTAT